MSAPDLNAAVAVSIGRSSTDVVRLELRIEGFGRLDVAMTPGAFGRAMTGLTGCRGVVARFLPATAPGAHVAIAGQSDE